MYFAHVPKCAGTSIEHYLINRFGPVGFVDWQYMDLPEEARWSKSSPQHVDVNTLSTLLPKHFIDESFSVVRHPVDRLLSVFRFQRDAVGSIETEKTFGAWLAGLSTRAPYYLDNHTLPMCQIVPEGAEVFKLEDGAQPIINWLDNLAGDTSGPRDIPGTNKLDDLLKVLGRKPGPPVHATEANIVVIKSLYKEDFLRFGYEIDR